MGVASNARQIEHARLSSLLTVPGSIIQTKLYLPRRRGVTVPRSRLSDILTRGLDARLTLVSAPAGFFAQLTQLQLSI